MNTAQPSANHLPACKNSITSYQARAGKWQRNT